MWDDHFDEIGEKTRIIYKDEEIRHQESVEDERDVESFRTVDISTASIMRHDLSDHDLQKIRDTLHTTMWSVTAAVVRATMILHCTQAETGFEITGWLPIGAIRDSSYLNDHGCIDIRSAISPEQGFDLEELPRWQYKNYKEISCKCGKVADS